MDGDDWEDFRPPGTIEDERRRLWHGPTPEERAQADSLGIDQIRAVCSGTAATVLAKVREVLDIVFAHSENDWPSDEAWREMLPSWFVAQCREEPEPKELHPLMALMYSLPPDQRLPFWLEHRDEWPPRQATEDTDSRWSVRGFAYWFRPEERQWWWWDAEVEYLEDLTVRVIPFDMPYSWGSLEWLLYAAGALHSESESGYFSELPKRRGIP